MNNYFTNCPGLSYDRIFTDYRSPVVREEINKRFIGITRDDNARMFYQKNGELIRDIEWIKLIKRGFCFNNACVHNYNTTTSNKEMYEEFKNYNKMMKHCSRKSCNAGVGCDINKNYYKFK